MKFNYTQSPSFKLQCLLTRCFGEIVSLSHHPVEIKLEQLAHLSSKLIEQFFFYILRFVEALMTRVLVLSTVFEAISNSEVKHVSKPYQKSLLINQPRC